MSIIIPYSRVGFFSCCSTRLYYIIDYINKHKELPKHVCSRHQFHIYRKSKAQAVFCYFKHYNNIKVTSFDKNLKNCAYSQFEDYSTLNYDDIGPIVTKYFTPVEKIYTICKTMEQKYNIDCNKCIGVYYRGTDKFKETQLANFNSFYAKIKEEPSKYEGSS